MDISFAAPLFLLFLVLVPAVILVFSSSYFLSFTLQRVKGSLS